MLWNEFVEGTGCKDSEYNFKVYKDLEVLYMSYDAMTKQDIYELGKKLVDNSPSEAELQFIQKMKAEIADLKEAIEETEWKIAWYKEAIEKYKKFDDEEGAKDARKNIRQLNRDILIFKSKIKRLEMIIQ